MDPVTAILEGMAPSAKHYHHGNLREALVDAAHCMIAEFGVVGLSLRKVAKHAGVSQAAPYHHFPNKDALLAEVAHRGFQVLTGGMLETSQTIDDPVERIRGLGRVYVEFGIQNPELYRLMFGAEHCPGEDYPAIQEAAKNCFGVLLQAIASGQQAGTFVGDNPVPVGLAVWSSMHGLVSLLHAKFHTSKEMGDVVVTAEMVTAATLAFVTGGLTMHPEL